MRHDLPAATQPSAERPHAVPDERPVVVALGGNAISPPGRPDSIAEQFRRTRSTAAHLVHLHDRPLVVTHGNGPQVGNALLRSELGAAALGFRLPLDICVADVQGGMGYMLQVCLEAAHLAAGTPRPAVTVTTRTVVRPDDPAFLDPAKPVGPVLDEAEARRRAAEDGWRLAEDPGRGWRRVVASPEPLEVVEEPAIRALLATGAVVVAAGGGGIPVTRAPDGTMCGVEAVVDKDLTSALLAGRLGAAVLLILTGVEHVAVDFGRPTRRDLHEVGAAELAGLADAGQFPPGSMLPKVLAALRFLAAGGQRAVITTPELSEKGLAGTAGTQVLA
jgi:carbamate kinase